MLKPIIQKKQGLDIVNEKKLQIEEKQSFNYKKKRI